MKILPLSLVGTILLAAASPLGGAALESAASNRGDVGPNISITTLPTTITQDFNTLLSSGSATWTNNSTLTGWYHARTGTGTTIVANDGSSNAGNFYSYGTGTNIERALGSIGSGNAAVGELFWGILLTNNTGATINTLDVSYTGEQWRNSAAAAHTVSFSFLVGTGLTGNLAEFQSAGTPVASLNFTSPITGGVATALDGNLAANRIVMTFSITGLSVAPGQDIMLRWSDPDHTGADHGLAIDDFSVTASSTGGPTPTPSPTATPTPSATPVPTRIRDIQGAAHLSPLSTQTVTNVPGIVTAKTSNGFYLQDPSPDSNDATSEGIFVFTTSAPTVNVGDSVLVGGTVVEFRPGGSSSTNLTITEISSPSIAVQSTGNPLPAPVVIGTGGRIPPMTVIDDDATGSVETSGTFDHTTDGIDFYESLEGMRVQMNAAVAVGPRTDFGEIAVLPDDGANAAVRTTRGGIVVRSADFNPERVFLDDTILATPMVNVGDHFSGPPVGVMDYSFGNFKLLITQALTAVSGGIAREVTTIPTPTQLAIATFNVENLDPGDPPAQFTALANLIVNNLRSPDIITLEEVQDNNGPTNDAVVDATTTYNALISAIQAAGGPTYTFRQVNPVDDQDGGEPGGNIRVGFLFRTDRGLAFVDRPGGCSTCATTVGSGPSGTELSFSPGRVDPTNSAFNNSRKPLAGEFTFNSHKLFLIANHFNSKGGDDPLFGRFQPPVLSSETQRNQQAQIVNNFVDSILALDSSAKIVVLGDLNDFHFSTPINTLKGGVLSALIETLPESERYTYVFEGNSQALDHILVSDSLFAGPFDYDVVHVNSEFADQISDHDPQVVRLTLGATTPTPTPSSTPTPSPTPSATPPTPTPTSTPTPSPTSSPTTPTPTATVSPTPTATATVAPSASPSCAPVTTVSYTGAPMAIPDNNTTGVNLVVAVAGVGTISDLDFRFDGTVSSPDPLSTTVGVNHSWVGDMIFRLTSPGGTTVTFYDRPGVPASTFGCSSNNLFALTIDDEAGSALEGQCPGGTDAGPLTGTFSGNNPLSAFDGQNPNGNWTLTAIDAAGGDVGTVRNFSLIFGGACTPTPTPTPPTPTPASPTPTCPPVITHSSSQAITPLNSVSCNNASGHTDNSYWRAFNMGTFAGGAPYNVTSVSFGVEEATGAGGTQPVTVRLYTNSGGAFPGGTRTQIATTTIQVLDSASGTVLNVPLVATVPAGTSELVMEVFTPNGQATGNFFFIGSNTAPETGPSYLSAADCGITNPTDTATIGFPDMNIVFNVFGNCDGPSPTPTVTPSTPTPTPTPTPTVTPTTPTPTPATPTPTPTPTPATPTPSPTVTPSPSPTPASKAINLSTRMLIQTGDNVGIGGFIISGNVPKDVIVRAIGPSLSQFDVPNVLADPVLELHGPSGFTTITNNNWRDTQEQEIQDTGIPPTNDLESAIVATLDPGAYTAIVRGNGNATGVALVEVYDLNQGVDSKLANLATRAFVSTGDNIVIAGFLLSDSGAIDGLGGPGDDRVIVRGIGPSLAPAILPVNAVLANPTLQLRDSNGTLILSNNDWQDNSAQAAEITAAGLAPSNDLESAIAATLPPGLYTALLAGLNNGTGIGVVEIYDRGP